MFSPPFIHNSKLFWLIRQLFNDVISWENILKIHPLLLTWIPLIEDIWVEWKFILPLFDWSSNVICIFWTEHRLNWHLMIFKLSHHFLTCSNDKVLTVVSIRLNWKESDLPCCLNLLKLFLDLWFTSGNRRNFFDFFPVFLHAHIFELFECAILKTGIFFIHKFENCFPMLWFERFVT